jgi:hypothetical protein
LGSSNRTRERLQKINQPLTFKDRRMKQNKSPAAPKIEPSFEESSQMKPPGVFFEFIDFLRHNKKWWLTPIVLVLLTLSIFVALTNTAIGPFIYVLF